jgi:hypothetical protein
MMGLGRGDPGQLSPRVGEDLVDGAVRCGAELRSGHEVRPGFRLAVIT